MGCASSSPLVNGGLVDSAKTAATEMMNTGEKAMNEVGDNLTETVGQVKESVVGSINGMAHSINEVIGEGITKIPLKEQSSAIEEAVESENHKIEENLENLKNEMLSKAQSIGDEADKIADELMKDTEDVIRDAETGIVNMKNSAMDAVETMKEDVIDVIKGNDVMSVDSLGTSVPEPEIENILNGESMKPTSPEATVGELANLNEMATDEMQPSAPPMESHDVPEAPVPAEKPLEDDAPAPMESSTPEISEMEQSKKPEDDLIVEDVKSMKDEKMIGLKLEDVVEGDEEETLAEEGVEEEEEVSEDVTEEAKPATTYWEEMHDVYFKKPILFSHAIHTSVESLRDDEEECALNLSNMYGENNNKTNEIKIQIQSNADDTLDVIDNLIKSFEKDVEMSLEAVPIVNVENE